MRKKEQKQGNFSHIYPDFSQNLVMNKRDRYELPQTTKHMPGNVLRQRKSSGIIKSTFIAFFTKINIFEVVILVLIVFWGLFDFAQTGKWLYITQNTLRPQCTRLGCVLLFQHRTVKECFYYIV